MLRDIFYDLMRIFSKKTLSHVIIIPMKKGALLINLGGPDSLEAVKPFLYNLFSDRDIIRLGPAFLQKPIARLISILRAPKTRKAYGLIGGASPLNKITSEQTSLVRERLENAGSGISVYYAMRYWHPFIEEVIESITLDGITYLVVICLYPQFSLATTGSSLRHFERVIKGKGIYYKTVRSWAGHPEYIYAIKENLKRALIGIQDRNVEILFSAHGLPISFIERGDPYVDEINRTISKVIEGIDIKWHLSFQSRSGPVRWLTPSTEEKIHEIAGKNIKNILIVPVSFISDHVETLYEIDIHFKEIAGQLGINLIRMESLNTNPHLINAIADIILKNSGEDGWIKS